MTDRAVSVTVNYVLGLAIATVLLSGIMFVAGGVVDDRLNATIRTELEVIGERMAANVMTADRLVAAGGTTVNVSARAPGSVAGAQYTVHVNASASDARLTLETNDPPVSVEVPFTNTTAVGNTTVGGGDLRITLDSGQLEVREA